MKRRIHVGLVTLNLVICLAAVARAQVIEEKSEKSIHLTVSSTEGPPQSEVLVQASLSTGHDVEVVSISVNITFPNKILFFAWAGKSGLAEGAGTEMKMEVETDTEDQDKSILRLTLSSTEERESYKALPEGPIAEIAFTISEDAQPGTQITLRSEASAMTTADPPKQREPITTEDGRISVIESLIFSCFFYMH